MRSPNSRGGAVTRPAVASVACHRAPRLGLEDGLDVFEPAGILPVRLPRRQGASPSWSDRPRGPRSSHPRNRAARLPLSAGLLHVPISVVSTEGPLDFARGKLRPERRDLASTISS